MKDTIILDSIGKVKEIIIHSKITLHTNPVKIDTEFFNMPESSARILIPVIVTLIVFILGQTINWRNDRKKVQNETKNYRKLILGWIDLIKHPVEKQIEYCKELATNILNSENLIPERFQFNNMLAEKAESINFERYISTFMINSTEPKEDNKNDKMTFNLISQFKFITSIEDVISKTYKEYQKEIYNFMNDWNKYFIQLDQIESIWSIQINDNTHPYYSFYNKFSLIVVEWRRTSDNGRSTIIHSIDQLISPLNVLINMELQTNPQNEFAFQLSDVLQQLMFINQKWKINISANNSLFNGFAESLEFSFKALSDAKEYFSTKTKIKNIFLIGN